MLGRRISLADLGMAAPSAAHADTGLDFSRDRRQAVAVAAEFWSTVDRRTLLTGAAASGTAHYATPMARRLVNPVEPVKTGGRRVGQSDIDEPRETAKEARRWDACYGGGNWKLSSVNACLAQRASPLLHGTYSEPIGRQLFTVTPELSRLAGWSAFDMGHHGLAQCHFIQALRMAKAGSDAGSGCYVLTTMALQALIRGFPREAVDMAQGAHSHAKWTAAPLVLSFAKPALARAHGKAGDTAAAFRTLGEAENLMPPSETTAGTRSGWSTTRSPGSPPTRPGSTRTSGRRRTPWCGAIRPARCRRTSTRGPPASAWPSPPASACRSETWTVACPSDTGL
ncbi:hypothetical protein ACFRAR_36935 [Kitasatospora sp. NPDC056651]|uniref:hypothetical protein n=1 Tax=Kitasatospora sp. NPDC056651 TaxID=3345892 RepID=UPI00367C6D5D